MKVLYLMSILPVFEAFTPSLPKAVIRGGGGGLSRLPYGVSDRRPAVMVRKMSETATERASWEDVSTEDDPEGLVLYPQDDSEVEQHLRDEEYKFQLHFRNFGDEKVLINVHHVGGVICPWHEGRACCWRQEIPANTSKGLSSGGCVYVPGGFVIHFGKWWEVIKDGIGLIYDVAMLFVPGPDPPANFDHKVPDDPKDGIEDALGIFGDVMGLTTDTIKALTDNEPIMSQEDYDEWIKKGQQAIPQAAAAAGITEQQVYELADEMELGDKWAFLAGDTYFEFIRDNNKETNKKNGWSVMKSMGGSKCKHNMRAAKACFIHKGHLIYPCFDWTGDLSEKWSFINDKLWFVPDCC